MMENPFYHNYLFNEEDLKRATIKWWEYPILWFLPMYVQINYGYAWKFKIFQGKYYFLKAEKLERL